MTEAAALAQLIDGTWPAAGFASCGPFRLRQGAGGGSRVSAATAEGDVTDADLAQAEAQMRGWGQVPLFMVRAGEDALDATLAARGYAVRDPVIVYQADAADLAALPLPPVTAFQAWPPMAVQREVWEEGGIGPERLAIMERAAEPKTSFLGRAGDMPAGAAFVAVSGDCAVLHALEVRAEVRRQGLGRSLMVAAARWAKGAGVTGLAVLVTRANPGRALYAGMGMVQSAGYHYRRHPDT